MRMRNSCYTQLMKKQKPTPKDMDERLKTIALIMSVNCVRNTVIENYHAGVSPRSKTGDYSDVKVVTPYGKISWNELSRINDKEMKAFNKEVADNIYTFLSLYLHPKYDDDRETFIKLTGMHFPFNWDKPKFDKDLLKAIREEKNRNKE